MANASPTGSRSVTAFNGTQSSGLGFNGTKSSGLGFGGDGSRSLTAAGASGKAGAFGGPRKAQTGQRLGLLWWFNQTYFWGPLADILVIANVVIVGMEVDNGPYTTWRVVLLSLYLLELVSHLWDKDWKNARFFLDVGIVVTAWLGVLGVAGDNSQRLWRLSVLRIHRASRLVKLAKVVQPLFDLWLVLTGLRRAFVPIVWFALILFAVLLTSAAAMRGLIKLGDGSLDVEEYFGSVPRSVMTLLQVATRDNWASHVVRPLLLANPIATIFLLAFVVLTSYGLLSLSVGVLVWSTVQLARSHDSHGSKKGVKEDTDLIKTLRMFFEAQLMMEEKEELTLKDLQEAFLIPQVRHALRQLELPVPDIQQLYSHLDKQRRGSITLDEFEKGVVALKVPAERFDVACLTANIGGSVSFCTRLQHRTDSLTEELKELRGSLDLALNELRRMATSEDEMGKVPEVVLRRQGKIKPGAPPKKQRYSEEGFRRW